MTTDKPTTVRVRIADLNVLMHCKTEFMVRRMENYLFDFTGEPEIVIDISEQALAAYCAKHVLMDRNNAEYMLSGAEFYSRLYRSFDGFMLHASAIEMDGKGYLFSANSGTGKSTHTALWQACFGARVQYINDDKPALRKTEKDWYVYGTPWSGKTELNTNSAVPLQAIAFIHRSAENSIERMEIARILPEILEQTIRPKTEKNAESYFALVEDLVMQIPIYSLGCNTDVSAAQLAYETMKQ